MKLTDLIGKEVQLYPGDTYSKFGIIEEISSEGFLIRITKASPSSEYKPGDITFISHSLGLRFIRRE